MKAYYDRRAPEYDEWYLGQGRFAALDRPVWADELERLTRALAALPPARTLDLACGTGFLTRHLPGETTGLDQSARMLERAAEQAPAASLVRGDALAPPFPDGAFGRVHAGHFYGHLDAGERERFLAEARRLAPELVLTDSALRDGVDAESVQERVLNDGSRHEVLKRYFTAEGLLTELGGMGDVLHAGRWFVAVRTA